MAGISSVSATPFESPLQILLLQESCSSRSPSRLECVSALLRPGACYRTVNSADRHPTCRTLEINELLRTSSSRADSCLAGSTYLPVRMDGDKAFESSEARRSRIPAVRFSRTNVPSSAWHRRGPRTALSRSRNGDADIQRALSSIQDGGGV
eukprot:GHVO01030082.1.p1 GENE.GHVO01030082.1~~GHVO01030082.1.p1  ORF type:complete len:152 (+),score=1.71 GHVO01030082.1:615-1070(+)